MQIPDEANDNLNRLAEWQQGDFSLSCGDLLFLDLPEEDDEPYEPVFDEGIEGCVVISQTCDVVREIEVLPNITVCPIVEIGAKRQADIEKGLAPRYGLIDNLPEGMVVDFSRAMSVSKQLLVTWERQRGCENEHQILELARALERFFGRFAFPDAFNESINSLRKAVYAKHEKDSDLGRALRSIREIRVLPHARWTDEDSVSITFIVVLEDADTREIRDQGNIYEAIADKFTGITWETPFSLHAEGLYLTTLSDMTASEYLNSYPLDLNALSYARRYAKVG